MAAMRSVWVLGSAPQPGFDLAPHLFNGIEV
jgi:hypothetical protein